jgi:hypothetical protein
MKSANDFRHYLQDKYKAEIQLYSKNHYGITVLTLSMIKVPIKKIGMGSKIMKEICNYADKTNSYSTLTPANDFGTPLTVLKKFYKSFGFKKNKYSWITGSMVRVPNGQ